MSAEEMWQMEKQQRCGNKQANTVGGGGATGRQQQ
jgi:hypothetical protein